MVLHSPFKLINIYLLSVSDLIKIKTPHNAGYFNQQRECTLLINENALKSLVVVVVVVVVATGWHFAAPT